MVTMKEWIKELKKLKLPVNEYAVFGSAPLCIRGLRKPYDLDIIVTKKLWKELRKKHPLVRKKDPTNKERIVIFIQIPTKHGIIDVFDNWHKPIFNINKLIKEADVIQGVRFVKLERVLEWKKKFNREKDKKDVKLIKKYLSNP
jgi:hypothetical protein